MKGILTGRPIDLPFPDRTLFLVPLCLRLLKPYLCNAAAFKTLAYTCRRLGVGRDSSFEEVQDARNYLYDVSATSDRLHVMPMQLQLYLASM